MGTVPRFAGREVLNRIPVSAVTGTGPVAGFLCGPQDVAIVVLGWSGGKLVTEPDSLWRARSEDG